MASENRGVYVGQKLAATLKVLVVASLANAQLWYTWRGGRFPTGWACGGSELAGVVFTAFEVADLLLGGIHGMMDAVYLVHHGLHIVLGLVLAANCMYCFTAAVLMSQETSTLFLNYVLLIRNRARAHWSFAPAFVAFAGCFFLWRLVLNSFGTAHFLYHKGSADATGVPDWLANVTAVVLINDFKQRFQLCRPEPDTQSKEATSHFFSINGTTSVLVDGLERGQELVDRRGDRRERLRVGLVARVPGETGVLDAARRFRGRGRRACSAIRGRRGRSSCRRRAAPSSTSSTSSATPPAQRRRRTRRGGREGCLRARILASGRSGSGARARADAATARAIVLDRALIS